MICRYYLGLGAVASRVEATMDRLHRMLSDSYDDVWSLRRLQASTLADPDLADKLAERQAAAAESAAANSGLAGGGGAGVGYGSHSSSGGGGVGSGRSGASSSGGSGGGGFGAPSAAAGGGGTSDEQSSLHAAAVEALVTELRDVRIDDVTIAVPPRPRAERPWRTSLLATDVQQ